MNFPITNYKIMFDKFGTYVIPEGELVLDIDDFDGIIDQMIAIHLGWAEPYTYTYFEETELLNWKDKSIQ